jgi:hypothetical protein
VSITGGRIAFADRHSIGLAPVRTVIDFDIGVGRARAEIYRIAPPANPRSSAAATDRAGGKRRRSPRCFLPPGDGGHRRGARRDRVLGAEPADRQFRRRVLRDVRLRGPYRAIAAPLDGYSAPGVEPGA